MSLHAGVSVREITPRTPMFLVGYPHVPRISTGVHDPLLASALCLRNDAGAVLLMAVDLLFISTATAREVRGRIAAQTGLCDAQIFISCTHTHSGPVTMDLLAWRDDPCVPPVDDAYLAWLVDALVAAAVEAAETPHDAALAWASADARGVGSNRLSPDGVTDPEAGVLAVRTRGGAWLALASIYGMHPTVLHEDSTHISGDFPAFTRQHLREALGEHLVVLYHNAPCGNQSPRYAVTAQTFAEAERLGRLLGERILTAVRRMGADDFSRDILLAGRLGSMAPIPRAMPSVAEAESLLRERVAEFARLCADGAGHGPVRTAECAVFGAEETLVLAQAQATGELARIHEAYHQAEVQAVRIGERVLVGWPCELFTEYARALKQRASLPVHPVCLVNGELQGYIVTQEAAVAGGYEAANSLFTPETGEALVAKGVELVAALHDLILR
ncbi:MAG TPA: neutral/alkaline non-lysosomal ceramidase N-terminal domain-containing protein [Armatimonadota bacterium]|jgi:hypothetical protein